MAEVIVVADRDEAGALAAGAVLDLAAREERPVLGVATGSTPLPVYRALAAARAAGDRRAEALRRVRAFGLDEYVGLPAGHPESYAAVLRREFAEPLGLPVHAVSAPRGDSGLETAGEDYERDIREAGGIQLQLLGIGTDGHIGFNEPGSSLASRTRVKTLTEQTRRDNARFFPSLDDVPRHCVTQGLGTILEAGHLVLLAFGEEKAEALAAAVEGPVTSWVPGSAIQLHPHVTVLVDEPAAARLRGLEYYRAAYREKPHWQGL